MKRIVFLVLFCIHFVGYAQFPFDVVLQQHTVFAPVRTLKTLTIDQLGKEIQQYCDTSHYKYRNTLDPALHFALNIRQFSPIEDSLIIDKCYQLPIDWTEEQLLPDKPYFTKITKAQQTKLLRKSNLDENDYIELDSTYSKPTPYLYFNCYWKNKITRYGGIIETFVGTIKKDSIFYNGHMIYAKGKKGGRVLMYDDGTFLGGFQKMRHQVIHHVLVHQNIIYFVYGLPGWFGAQLYALDYSTGKMGHLSFLNTNNPRNGCNEFDVQKLQIRNKQLEVIYGVDSECQPDLFDIKAIYKAFKAIGKVCLSDWEE